MKAPNVEVERRFLVRSGADGWRGRAEPRDLLQGYLSTDPQRVVRIRIDGDAAWLTVKGVARGPGRTEIETAIDLSAARAILERSAGLCVGTPIEKTRWTLRAGALTWEIDEFAGRNAGLRIAEVEHDGAEELDSWNARVDRERPDWLGTEITGDARFANSALTMKPFDEFDESERVRVLRGG